MQRTQVHDASSEYREPTPKFILQGLDVLSTFGNMEVQYAKAIGIFAAGLQGNAVQCMEYYSWKRISFQKLKAFRRTGKQEESLNSK